jgi:hypothetical protein
MMVRTQIQLTKEQSKLLKESSLMSRESVASLNRKAIDQFLVTTRQPDRALLYRRANTIVGKYAADQQDIALRHDHYLDEAYGS